MDCDLCGRTGEMYKAVIEGSEMTVCSPCTQYGETIGKIRTEPPSKKAKKQNLKTVHKEESELFVTDLGEIIKRKREQMGLNQKQFAVKIAEKESILKKIEVGQLFPTIEKARKLERLFGIKLIEEVEDSAVHNKKEPENLTLGDIAKIKRKKELK